MIDHSDLGCSGGLPERHLCGENSVRGYAGEVDGDPTQINIDNNWLGIRT